MDFGYIFLQSIGRLYEDFGQTPMGLISIHSFCYVREPKASIYKSYLEWFLVALRAFGCWIVGFSFFFPCRLCLL